MQTAAPPLLRYTPLPVVRSFPWNMEMIRFFLVYLCESVKICVLFLLFLLSNKSIIHISPQRRRPALHYMIDHTALFVRQPEYLLVFGQVFPQYVGYCEFLWLWFSAAD